MQISDQQINQFIELYLTEYGVEIDKKTAYEKGVRLIRLMQLTYLPNLIKPNKKHEEHRTKI